MNLVQLSYFCRLADVEHYTKAAHELNITQSRPVPTPWPCWSASWAASCS